METDADDRNYSWLHCLVARDLAARLLVSMFDILEISCLGGAPLPVLPDPKIR